ncbi:MAG: hypothetical protein JW940_08215 [Polyangiaceae bacterium]|nr:hypothetical protein [Polyangiaceae bacterium]
MIPRGKVAELVATHEALAEDPAAAAVWIRRDEPTVWLVEVVPTLRDDDTPEEPIFFNPGVRFRFPLALIAGTRRTLEITLRANPELASGEVMLDRSGDARALVELASELAAA